MNQFHVLDLLTKPMQLYFNSYFGYVIQKWPANKPAINGAY